MGSPEQSNLCVYLYPSSPEVGDQTLPTHDANQQSTQDRQFQWDHSFRLDHSVHSDRPFCESGQQLAGDHPPQTFPTMQPALKFVRGTPGSALYLTAGTPIRAGHLTATGHTQANGVQNTPNELSGAQTPLRHAQFERELAGHPDKAWVSKLLTAIKIGVRIGHTGPRHYTHATCPQHSSTLRSCIDQELANECDRGRILGPFTTPLIYPLHCSGLGTIPKKNGKW